MIVINYWHKLSKRFIIKAALSHLLLGVIAAGFSLSGQSALPVSINQSVNIITIASIAMASLQEQQIVAKIQYQPCPNHKNQVVFSAGFPANYSYIVPINHVRLTPYNGIRAGPMAVSV